MSSLKSVALGVLALLTGCTAWDDPHSATPALTEAQKAELRQRTVNASPRIVLNDIVGLETVTVRLVEMVSGESRNPTNRYRVPVVMATVNGRPGVSTCLDTGSTVSLFGYSLAKKLRIPVVEGMDPVSASAIGGDVRGLPALMPALQVGAMEFRNVVAMIGPDARVLRAVNSLWQPKHMMLLGAGALQRLSYVSIDCPRGEVTFAPFGAYAPRQSRRVAAKVPLLWVEGRPAVKINLDGRATIDSILDTGCDCELMVPSRKAEELGYKQPGTIVVPSEPGPGNWQGVGGAVFVGEFEVEQLTLGEAAFTRVAAYTLLSKTSGKEDHVLLGNGLLCKYRVTFDFFRSVLWLEQ